MSLGAKLKELREDKGMTQAEVGAYISKTKQMISLYESDANIPPLNILSSLAKLYGVTLNELDGGSALHDAVFSLQYETEKGNKDGAQKAREEVDKAADYLNKINIGQGIPYYESDIDLLTGDIESFNDGSRLPTDYLRLPGIKDCDFSCRVVGDTIINKVKPGSIIACREVIDKDLIQFGDIFLIFTAENRWLRIIRKHELKDHLLLKSQNPEYDDIDCPKEKILRLFAIKVIINQEQM